MALLARMVLASSMLSIVHSACENLLAQDFALYAGGSKKYSVDHAKQDFPSTSGPYKMIDDADHGVPLTLVDGAIKGFFGKGKLSGKETGIHSVSQRQQAYPE